MPFTSRTFDVLFISKTSSVVFARCLVMVDKSFGLAFTHVCGAPELLVSYFTWFGWQPDGTEPFFMLGFVVDRLVVATVVFGPGLCRSATK